MDNALTLDAETAAALECKAGDTKTIEVEVLVDKNDAEGFSGTVLGVSHYAGKDEEKQENETMEEGDVVPGSAIPSSNQKYKSTPKAVKNLMY